MYRPNVQCAVALIAASILVSHSKNTPKRHKKDRRWTRKEKKPDTAISVRKLQFKKQDALGHTGSCILSHGTEKMKKKEPQTKRKMVACIKVKDYVFLAVAI